MAASTSGTWGRLHSAAAVYAPPEIAIIKRSTRKEVCVQHLELPPHSEGRKRMKAHSTARKQGYTKVASYYCSLPPHSEGRTEKGAFHSNKAGLHRNRIVLLLLGVHRAVQLNNTRGNNCRVNALLSKPNKPERNLKPTARHLEHGNSKGDRLTGNE